jgi:NAD+ kinase
VLESSGQLAVEVDGEMVGDLEPGDWLHVGVDLTAGSVVRLGHRSFYARARRKLHISDSAELI